ncbi:MAG: hypothetical protein ACW9W3_02340 [Candidatus Nitrosopumilus sp. bin_68KS]
MVWVAEVFYETEKMYDSILLKESDSFESKSEFLGHGIGYYKMYMPEFSGEAIFVQILDTKNNIIQEEKIQTKLSVGYFDFNEDGKYILKITNISNNSINLETEFGDTNSQKMLLPGMVILFGSLIMMITCYFKIKNYRIEQPEENIS